MGSITGRSERETCPNCGVRGTHENDGLWSCYNENCAVDRFWGAVIDG